MAAKKRRPPRDKGAKKALRGKLPVKRSINLVLVDENKISLPKAILGVVLIVLLAGLFGKYMVVDRLMEMSQSASRAAQARADLARAETMLKSFGEIEGDYAHYTYDGMTAAELGLVDRIRVLKLMRTMLPSGETTLDIAEFVPRMRALIQSQIRDDENALDPEDFNREFWNLIKRIVPLGYSVQSWSVTENLLSIEVQAVSLERLNRLARELEQQPIVDSCAITTANKRGKKETSNIVAARLLVYLRQPPETEEEAEAK